MKNIRIFIGKLPVFLVVKFSIYLNRHVFVIIQCLNFMRFLLSFQMVQFSSKSEHKDTPNLITKIGNSLELRI